MKLRNKLKLSFVIITVIPICMILLSLFFIGMVRINTMEKQYNIEIDEFTNLVDQTKLYNILTKSEVSEIEAIISDDSDKLLDEKYLDELSMRLNEKYSFIVIIKNDDIHYNKVLGHKDLIEALYEERDGLENKSSRLVSRDSVEYMVRTESYTYSDGAQGYAFIVTEYGKIFPEVKNMLREILVTLVAIILLTGAILTFWIYTSVMSPLKKISQAAKNIADGNLEFELQYNKNDEFGEMYKDFEHMRKRLKESAEQRIIDDNENKILISNISHDLKTPITSIKGYVEGIMDGVADTPEKMDKYIKTIYNKANDMDKLIAELTMYSNIDNNRIPYNFAKINLSEYFKDCADELRIDLEQRGIEFNYSNYVDESVLIIADAEQLKRVVNNIVSNAIKYIGNKKGIINLKINDEIDFIHIEIEDNGKGIDVKDLPLIFDRFYRTDASRNSNQGGSGIGLSIAKKIIEEHSGKIWATSKIGTGTTLHIVIRKYIENTEARADE